jgi:hypothetical protein
MPNRAMLFDVMLDSIVGDQLSVMLLTFCAILRCSATVVLTCGVMLCEVILYFILFCVTLCYAMLYRAYAYAVPLLR